MPYYVVIGTVDYCIPRAEGEEWGPWRPWKEGFVRERVIARDEEQAREKALFVYADKLGDVNADFNNVDRLIVEALTEEEYMGDTKQPQLFDRETYVGND